MQVSNEDFSFSNSPAMWSLGRKEKMQECQEKILLPD